MNLNYYFFHSYYLLRPYNSILSKSLGFIFHRDPSQSSKNFFIHYEYYPLPEVRNFRIKALNSLGWFCCRATITFRTCFWTHFVHGWIQRPLNISGATPEKCNKYGNNNKVLLAQKRRFAFPTLPIWVNVPLSYHSNSFKEMFYL